MAIDFKYNKTSLHEMGKQLKVRESALPTLKSKEAALRQEVKTTKQKAEEFHRKLEAKLEEIKTAQQLWAEFPEELVKVKHVEYKERSMAGVKIPVLGKVEFDEMHFSLFNNHSWFLEGIEILKALTQLNLQVGVKLRSVRLLEYARKKTSQKVNLYEKVQIPGYIEAISKIKRYLEDEENLAKSAQKILKKRNEEKLEMQRQ